MLYATGETTKIGGEMFVLFRGRVVEMAENHLGTL